MFSGFMLAHVTDWTMIDTMVWLPAILACLVRADSTGRRRWGALGSLALGVAFLAGHPQLFYHVVLATVALGLTLAARRAYEAVVVTAAGQFPSRRKHASRDQQLQHVADDERIQAPFERFFEGNSRRFHQPRNADGVNDHLSDEHRADRASKRPIPATLGQPADDERRQRITPQIPARGERRVDLEQPAGAMSPLRKEMHSKCALGEVEQHRRCSPKWAERHSDQQNAEGLTGDRNRGERKFDRPLGEAAHQQTSGDGQAGHDQNMWNAPLLRRSKRQCERTHAEPSPGVGECL
jgi:hypothetical protein